MFSSSVNTFASDKISEAVPSYSTVTEVEDWGVCVTKLIVNLGEAKVVSQGSITKDTFKVDLVRYQENGVDQIQIHDPADVNWQTPNKMIPLPGGQRTVTNAYVSDKAGNPKVSSNLITLELKIVPEDNLSAAIYAKQPYVSAWSVNKYTITQQENINTSKGIVSGITITNSTGGVRKAVEDFKTGSFKNAEDNVTLTFADYTPIQDNKKNPLIIWYYLNTDGSMAVNTTIGGYDVDESGAWIN